MDEKALVELALKALKCTQNELAARLKVSATQISKWKSGEHMSEDMRDKLGKLANLPRGLDAGFVANVGSVQAAEKWTKLIAVLAALAAEDEETGYDTPHFAKDGGVESTLLCPSTFTTLKDMGIEIPQQFPEELEIAIADRDEDGFPSDEALDAINMHSIARLVRAIYKSLSDVYGFYVAYVQELTLIDQRLEDELAEVDDDINAHIVRLAASKLDANDDVDLTIAKNFTKFRYDTEVMYGKWIRKVKAEAFRAGAPLRAELMDMVFASHDELGHQAERESLGFNASQLHPDIYMNELLMGMRTIHQVLPAILKKLKIKFALDESELVNGRMHRTPVS